MRRILIVLGVVFAGWGLIYGGTSFALFYGLTQADAYPAFMTDYQVIEFRTYEDAERGFSDFVAKTFPIGAAASDAIGQISRGGCQITTSGSETIELVWKRHNGPCNERYSIVVSGDADGRIAKIVGQLRPICL
jgi:hypothetical protein